MLKKFFVLTIFIAMHNVLIASQNPTAQIQLTKDIQKYSFEGFEFGDHLSKEDNNDNLRGLIQKRKEHLSIPCCNNTFSWPDFLNHFKTNHESQNNHYNCPYENCKKTFCYHESARNHYITHYAPNLFACACCNQPYQTQQGLKAHFLYCMKKFGLTKKNNNTLAQENSHSELENGDAFINENAVNRLVIEGYEFGDHISPKQNNFNFKCLMAARRRKITVPYNNKMLSWAAFRKSYREDNAHNKIFPCVNVDCPINVSNIERAFDHYAYDHTQDLLACPHCKKKYFSISSLSVHFKTCIKNANLPKHQPRVQADTLNDTQNTCIDLGAIINESISDSKLENDDAFPNQDAANRLVLEGYEFGDNISPKQNKFNFKSLLEARRRKITIPYKDNMLSWVAFRNRFKQDNAQKTTFPCINDNCSIINLDIKEAIYHHAQDHNQYLLACPKCTKQYRYRYLGTHFKKCIKKANLPKHQPRVQADTLNDIQNTRIELGAIINESIEELEHISGSNTNIM